VTAAARLGERSRSLVISPTLEAVLLGLGALVLYWVTGPPADGDVWPPLAEAFLSGRLYLPVDRPWLELVPRLDGGQYVPLPPVPALTLIPLALITGPDTAIGELAGNTYASVVGGINVALAYWLLSGWGVAVGPRRWLTAGFALTTEADAPKATEWTGTRRTEVLATWKDVSDRLGRPDAAILDTRTDGEYCGTTVRAARGGVIPGAVHLEWTRNLGPDGAFKPAAELRAMYEKAGITADREVVPYCQGGYRAAHSYLALRLLGYPRLRNYLGSWREWGDRLDLPIEHPDTP